MSGNERNRDRFIVSPFGRSLPARPVPSRPVSCLIRGRVRARQQFSFGERGEALPPAPNLPLPGRPSRADALRVEHSLRSRRLCSCAPRKCTRERAACAIARRIALRAHATSGIRLDATRRAATRLSSRAARHLPVCAAALPLGGVLEGNRRGAAPRFDTPGLASDRVRSVPESRVRDRRSHTPNEEHVSRRVEQRDVRREELRGEEGIGSPSATLVVWVSE